MHKQYFRFAIDIVDEPIRVLTMTSNLKLLPRHDENKHVKYQRIRSKERDEQKEILKYLSARVFQLETVHNADKEMWHNGHAQNLMRLNALQKVKFESNNETRLTLHSKDLQDLHQLWVEEQKLEDPYLRHVSLSSRAPMHSEQQLQLVLSDDANGTKKKVRIVHMD